MLSILKNLIDSHQQPSGVAVIIPQFTDEEMRLREFSTNGPYSHSLYESELGFGHTFILCQCLCS